MQIFSELNFNPELSIALGFFDGVHLGHQKVIKNAVNFAKKNNVKSAVITFYDHPHCHFYGVCPKYILQREDRIKAFEELGVDYLYILKFDEEIYKMSAKEYLEKILIHNFFPTALFTGFNHNFGAKKSGNAQYLKDLQEKFNYEYFEIPPQKINEDIISSTSIRNALTNGDLEKANAMLGYEFFVKGKIIEGNKIGRTIGFNTANILYPPELVDIPFGVYSVNAYLNGEKFKAIANFGLRPTVTTSNKAILEVHIKDFNKDIYGENLKVSFIKKIRSEKKFNSLDELKTQIQKDLNQC